MSKGSRPACPGVRLAPGVLLLIALLALPAATEDRTSFRATVHEDAEKRDRIKDADALLLAGETREALSRYQTLIDDTAEDSGSELIESERKVASADFRAYEGVKAACCQRLWEVVARDPAALATYRSMYDARAQDLVKAGTAMRNVVLLARAASAYGPSSWGDEAARILIDLHLEAGDNGTGTAYAEQLLAHWDQVAGPPMTYGNLYGRVLIGHARSGRLERVVHYGGSVPVSIQFIVWFVKLFLPGGGAFDDAAGALIARWARLPVTLGGRRVPLAAVRRQCLRAAAGARASLQGTWSCLGGSVTHRCDMASAWTVVGPGWKSVFHTPPARAVPKSGPPARNPAAAQLIPREILDPGIREDKGFVNPLGLVVTRGIALVHDGQSVRGADLATGKLTDWSVSDALPGSAGGGAGIGTAYVPFGLATHGNRVFSLHRSAATVRPGGLPHYTLRCTDLATEGKRLWDSDQVVDAPSRACYAELSFTGQPIVDGNRVYIGALETRMDMRAHLVCLDARTGQLLWKSMLCAEQVEPNATSVHSSLAPAKAGGRVFYCSNQGVVGAFDALTGDVAWAAKYPRSSSSHDANPLALKAGWADNPPIVVGDALYVAPQDSESLLVFEAATGALLSDPGQFKRFTDSDSYTWMVAGQSDCVYLVGERSAAGSVRSGRGNPNLGLVLPILIDRRTNATILPEPPKGRPGVCGNVLYVPTTKALRRVVLPGKGPSPDPTALVTWAADGSEPGDVVVVEGWALVLSPKGVLRGYPTR